MSTCGVTNNLADNRVYILPGVYYKKKFWKLQKLAGSWGPPPRWSDGTLIGVSLKNNAPVRLARILP